MLQTLEIMAENYQTKIQGEDLISMLKATSKIAIFSPY